jgi:hypothetical protein
MGLKIHDYLRHDGGLACLLANKKSRRISTNNLTDGAVGEAVRQWGAGEVVIRFVIKRVCEGFTLVGLRGGAYKPLPFLQLLSFSIYLLPKKGNLKSYEQYNDGSKNARPTTNVFELALREYIHAAPCSALVTTSVMTPMHPCFLCRLLGMELGGI